MPSHNENGYPLYTYSLHTGKNLTHLVQEGIFLLAKLKFLKLHRNVTFIINSVTIISILDTPYSITSILAVQKINTLGQKYYSGIE